MSRPLRLAVPGGLYHVTARGIERRPIYADDRDRAAFLERLGRAVDRFDWRCLSFCLMDNHVHLLLRTPEPNLPRGMQFLKGSYAQWFNRRHDRIGPLYAGRYGARLVQEDRHLLATFRYVAQNPVAAGLCSDPVQWVWSAHAALLGRCPSPSFLAVEEALTWFADEPEEGRRAYASLVATPSEVAAVDGGAASGDAAFLREVLPARRPSPDIPRREWGAGRPPLDEVFADVDRDRAIARAYRDHGYPLSAIARHLGCHVSTVSRGLRACERRA